MIKSNKIKLIGITIILISLSFIFILITANYFNNKFENIIFSNINTFLYEVIGSYHILLFSFLLLLGIIILLPIQFQTKLFLSVGYILLGLFIPPFLETFKITNLNSGLLGIKLAELFYKLGNPYYLVLYFFWFSTSLFLILYPIRNKLAELIITVLFLKNEKKHEMKKNINNSSKKIKSNNNINNNSTSYKIKFPWLSKVIYENLNRVEIPILPNNDKIKKFKLINQDDTVQEFEELPKNFIHSNFEDPNVLNNYYDKLRHAWPKKWQENVVPINENFIDNIEELEVVPSDEIDSNDNSLIDEFKHNSVLIEKVNMYKKGYNLNSSIDNNISSDSNFREKINKKELINSIESEDYNLPEINILENSQILNHSQFKAEHKESALILENTLKEFDIEAKVCEIIHGPVVTLYKLIPAPGIKLQKIEGLSNNLALRLAAKSIRIIAPIPGEKVVGIEIPNRTRELVRFKEIVKSEVFTESSYSVPIGLGKDIYGNIIVIDLFKMPHVLIAGATGAGKSVCINTIISSILFSKTPDEVRLIFIDPKIVELKPYNNIPHLLTPVITDAKKAIIALKYLLYEMERRYSLLDQMGARDIVEYQKRKSKKSDLEELPFIVAIVDEFADLMSTSGKEAEFLFAKIAAKARAVGIHLVLATQRPSADVITGLIKANIPARIAFQVIALQDSRIILDQKGAEKLLGQGDMLYLSPTQPFPIRLQGAYLSKEEVDLITDHWKSISPPKFINIEELINIAEENEDIEFEGDNEDPLFEQALEIVYATQKASASYLQRRLGIGYNRAARMVEEMERMGIVGPQRGAKPREIISSLPDYKYQGKE